MSHSPIFLYLKSSALDNATLKRIRSAGYVPIAVESFDSVKVLEPITVSTGDAIARAAFQTVAESELGGVRERFGKRVSLILCNPKP